MLIYIYISNLNFRNGKFKITDYENFIAENATLKADKNGLKIIPKSPNFSVIYKPNFKLRAAIKFEFEVFIIILVLSFLLFNKLLDYVADFKTIKHKSRIEILFLICFFIILFIPMLHIDDSKTSKYENRTLATWKPFINKHGKINFNFGKDFDSWFNDRFNLRNELVSTNSSLTFLLNHKNDKGIIDYTNEHLYNNSEFKTIKIKEIKENFRELNQFNNFCKEHNIRLYTIIVPNKSFIYPSKYNIYLKKSNHQDFISYLSELKKQNEMKLIYPYEEMLEASKNNFVFFKTEHHWTDDGAFVGYKTLMKEIKKDFPNTNILTDDDFEYFYNKKIRGDWERNFRNGQTCHRLGLQKDNCEKFHNVDYKYFKHKNYKDLKQQVTDIDYHKNKIYFYGKGANHRVLLLGTSQAENLTEFIPFTFKNVKRIRNNNVKKISNKDIFKIMKYYKQEILEYKPNIIIFCITYNNIQNLHNLFNED